MGDNIFSKIGMLQVEIISSPEFGSINNMTIIKGVIGANKEDEYINIKNINKYLFNRTFEVSSKSTCYFRCEVEINSDSERIFAMSNPIWLDPNSD